MDEKIEQALNPQPMLEAWLKAAADFWGPVMGKRSEDSAKPQDSAEESATRRQKALESALKSWQALSAAMSEPQARQSLFNGIHALPEIVMKMTQTGWDGFFNLQQKWSERLGRIGKTTETYKFENLDQEAVTIWRELYEKEFRQLLHMPQLGLTRLYQERANQTADKFNLLQGTLAEFLHLLYLPMERSFQVLQDKVAEMADEGQLPENPKAYYQMWMKILEGHYMTLLKSPDYTQKMGETLTALQDFRRAKNAFLQDLIKLLPVPTETDMDELYKEIYTLKKRIRQLEKQAAD